MLSHHNPGPEALSKPLWQPAVMPCTLNHPLPCPAPWAFCRTSLCPAPPCPLSQCLAPLPMLTLPPTPLPADPQAHTHYFVSADHVSLVSSPQPSPQLHAGSPTPSPSHAVLPAPTRWGAPCRAIPFPCSPMQQAHAAPGSPMPTSTFTTAPYWSESSPATWNRQPSPTNTQPSPNNRQLPGALTNQCMVSLSAGLAGSPTCHSLVFAGWVPPPPAHHTAPRSHPAPHSPPASSSPPTAHTYPTAHSPPTSHIPPASLCSSPTRSPPFPHTLPSSRSPRTSHPLPETAAGTWVRGGSESHGDHGPHGVQLPLRVSYESISVRSSLGLLPYPYEHSPATSLEGAQQQQGQRQHSPAASQEGAQRRQQGQRQHPSAATQAARERSPASQQGEGRGARVQPSRANAAVLAAQGTLVSLAGTHGIRRNE